MLFTQAHQMQTERRLADRQLTVIVPRSTADFSLSPINSDYWGNLLIMENVVGTLVKYNAMYDYEPFLAKSWKVSDSGLVWSFELNSELYDETGLNITAEGFVKSFKRLLLTYSKTYDPPCFSNLIGWADFKSGKVEKLAVYFSSNTVIFEFESKPSGLLEFLSMPYFGYYSERDFGPSGEWKNKKVITATGHYRVIQASDASVTLSKRTHQKAPANSPEAVYFFREGESEIKTAHSIFAIKDKPLKDYSFDEKNFVTIKSTPTNLSAFALSPFKGIFKSTQVRYAFKNLLRLEIDNLSQQLRGTRARSFYPDFESATNQKNELNGSITELQKLGPQEISVFTYDSNMARRDSLYKTIVSNVANQLGWTTRFESPDTIGVDWQNVIRKNNYVDLRIVRVDIGGTPESWVINMMFCSTLGVSFPDPDGLICDISSKYESSNDWGTDYLKKYAIDFHQILDSQNSVIPIEHIGFDWVLSKNIKVEGVSPTMIVLRLDKLVLHE